MNQVCPICNKPKSQNCSCMSRLQESQNNQKGKQVLIEDGTMSTFGYANISEIKVQK